MTDDGPGIPTEYQEIIFRKFERVRAANAPRVRSSGLGLTFCRLAVESHGGRIWVKSAEGEGSTFYVQLPLAPAEPARTLSRPAKPPRRRPPCRAKQDMKAYLRTFGCRANQYDTEAVRAMIEAAGGEVVTTPREADVALFNSCAVTSAAEADLGRPCGASRPRRRGIRSVVFGCASALDDRNHRGACRRERRDRRARTSPRSQCLWGSARRLQPLARARRPARADCSAYRTDATSIAPSAPPRSRAARIARGPRTRWSARRRRWRRSIRRS